MLMAGNGKGAVGPLCTGTLVAPDWVVTAAHCIDEAEAWADKGYTDLMFWLGDSVAEPGEILGVVAQHVHPSYTSGSSHDVALVQLSAKAKATPMGLDPLPLDDRTGELVTLVGFGVTTHGGEDSGTKHETSVAITGLTDTSITTQHTGTNACSGDSGGPVLASTDGGYTITAVISSIDPNGSGDPCLDGTTNATRLDNATDFLALHLPTGEPDPEDTAVPDDTAAPEDTGALEDTAAPPDSADPNQAGPPTSTPSSSCSTLPNPSALLPLLLLALTLPRR